MCLSLLLKVSSKELKHMPRNKACYIAMLVIEVSMHKSKHVSTHGISKPSPRSTSNTALDLTEHI